MPEVDAETGTINGPPARPLSSVSKGYTYFQEGDVLFAKITPCMENGKSAVARDLVNGIGFGSTEFHVLRPSKAVLADYVWRYVRQVRFRREAEQQMTGTVGQARVPAEFMNAVEFPLPPLADQRSILRTLSDTLGKMESVKERLSTVRPLISRFHGAVLIAACCGRLTNDYGGIREPTMRIGAALQTASTRRKGRRSEQPVDLDLPTLPERYGVAYVGDVALTIEYGTSRKADADSGGIPILRMSNIQDGKLDLSDLKFIAPAPDIESLILKQGDLLFNRTNSPELVGKCAVFNGGTTTTFASYLIRVRFDTELADPTFVCFWMNSAWGRSWARLAKTDGVSQSNINGTKLALMPVPLPPIDEQREIVQRAGRLLGVAQTLADRVTTADREVDQATEALLAKAFRGGLATIMGVRQG
jgi:type I restriction enzyme S subunit